MPCTHRLARGAPASHTSSARRSRPMGLRATATMRLTCTTYGTGNALHSCSCIRTTGHRRTWRRRELKREASCVSKTSSRQAAAAERMKGHSGRAACLEARPPCGCACAVCRKLEARVEQEHSVPQSPITMKMLRSPASSHAPLRRSLGVPHTSSHTSEFKHARSLHSRVSERPDSRAHTHTAQRYQSERAN